MSTLVPFLGDDKYFPTFIAFMDCNTVDFSQMNDILGDDYEKKMAVIGVLKQYAEDRDVEILGRALAAILKTPQQRTVIKQIRYVRNHGNIYI